MLRAPVGSYIYPILHVIQDCFEFIKSWTYTFIYSIFGNNGALSELKPLFCIGIAVAVIFVAILFIKKVVWGR